MTDDPPDAPEDPGEELDSRPDPRRTPRWLVLLGVLVLVVGAGVLIVRSDVGGPGSRSSAPSTAGPTRPNRPALRPLVLPDDVNVVPTGDGRLLYFTGNVLSLIDPSGRHVAERRYPETGDAARRRQARLLVDAYAGVVWVVAMNGDTRGYADKFTYDALEPIDRVRLPGVVTDVAAVGGDLFVTTDGPNGGGLWQLPRFSDGFVKTDSSDVVRLVGDDVQQRPLLLVRSGDRLTLAEFGSGGKRVAAPRLVGEPDLVEVDGYIWGVGSLDGRAWIARLDPRTLRFGANRAPSAYERSAVLAGTGDHSLFLQIGLDVDCFDLSAGRVVERFRAAHGPVAATHRRGVFADSDGSVVSRPLGRCPG